MMYVVKVDGEHEDVFFSVRRLDRDAVIELEGFEDSDGDGADAIEVYSIATAFDIDRILDLEEGVLSYRQI